MTDEEIAKQVQAEDKEAFGLLVDRYEKKLLRYGNKFLSNREDIKDIVQDVFMNAYKNIQSFDTNQKFSSWVYRIAHNALVNALKKSSREAIPIFDFDVLVSHPIYEDPTESEREAEEIKKEVNKSLENISAKYREILILYYIEELQYKEIADILKVPMGTVGIRLKRAKEALRQKWKTTT